MQLITYSRQQAFKECRKKHWFSYELGVRKETDPASLRIGSAVHDACEALENTGSIEAACEVVYRAYENQPPSIDTLPWQYERETVLRLMTGYEWRWKESRLRFVVAEQSFRIPLTNPATGAKSRTFEIAGKIDGIVTLPDGRLAVLERKTTSDDIGSDSDLWPRLQIDHQISNYVLAARRIGHPVDAVLYDVIRKPTIKPTKVPILDDLGCKVVLDSNGNRVMTKTASGKDNGWRQTGDKAKGYVLQEREMTPDEWGEKLTDDITNRPEWYYVRREIPRLDQDLEEFASELWDVSKGIRQAQREDLHYRTVNRNTCPYCSFFGLCASGWRAGDSLPEGFQIIEDVHPELGEANVNSSPQDPSPAQGTASPAAVG